MLSPWDGCKSTLCMCCTRPCRRVASRWCAITSRRTKAKLGFDVSATDWLPIGAGEWRRHSRAWCVTTLATERTEPYVWTKLNNPIQSKLMTSSSFAFCASMAEGSRAEGQAATVQGQGSNDINSALHALFASGYGECLYILPSTGTICTRRQHVVPTSNSHSPHHCLALTKG